MTDFSHKWLTHQSRLEIIEEGVLKGAKQERFRIAAILGCEEAKGRENLARYLAFETDMDATKAKGMLGKAAVQAPPPKPKPLDRLARAMAMIEQPQIASQAPPEDSGRSRAEQVLAAYNRACGVRTKG